MSDDIYNEDNKSKPQWIGWGKPGDEINGVLIDVTEQESKLPDQKGKMVKIYDILVEGGEFHEIVDEKPSKTVIKLEVGDIWKVGGRKVLDQQMRRVKLGQKIGIKYDEEGPAQPGLNAAKYINMYTNKEMDKEWCRQNGIDPDNAPTVMSFIA